MQERRGRRCILSVTTDHDHGDEIVVIGDALAARTHKIGFRGTTSTDDSPGGARKTQLAVARAREGDPVALRFLYVTYSNNVYGYVRSIVHDEHEAEDVTQHVFAKLMTCIGKYEPAGGAFLAWLLRVARNVAVDHLRANRVTPTATVVDPAPASREDPDRIDAVRTALARLPDEHREVVVLRHIVGLTPGEIAERMGRTTSSIHSLHHRGRRMFQRELIQLDSAPFTRRARARAA
jgi:RNA polymerase sigma-70 factor (ECF subfamily)